MTLSRAGVGAEARGSWGGQRGATVRRQEGKAKGSEEGLWAGGLPAAGTAAPRAGGSPDRLQQAFWGNRPVFFNSWFDIMKAEQPPKQP